MPDTQKAYPVLWQQLRDNLLASGEIELNEKKNVIATIRIAKSLVSLGNSCLKHFPEFWRFYTSLVKGPNFLEMSARLSMSEFCNLLYTCAHLELFDKQHEWPILLEAFCRKLKY